MRTTSKFLSLLTRAFDRDPRRVLALRLSYNGMMKWRVRDGILTTEVWGGTGVDLAVDLTAYTVTGLASYLSGQPGYSVPYTDSGAVGPLGARTLMDGEGDIALSNGDHLYAYTSVTWAYLESLAAELAAAKAQIGQMLRQMSTKTAESIWLDEIGGYYGVPRLLREVDATYGRRIILEVLRPRANNVAMEAAIKEFTGQQVTVTDVTAYQGVSIAHSGVFTHNAAINYGEAAVPVYGMFDVVIGYDPIVGSSPNEFAASVARIVGLLRDAGTQMRSLSLVGSDLADTFDTPPVDGAGIPLALALALTDAADAGNDDAFALAFGLINEDDYSDPQSEELVLEIGASFTYDAFRTHNAAITYNADVLVETV